MGYCIEFEESTMRINKHEIENVMQLLSDNDLRWCDSFDIDEIDFDDFNSINETWRECLRYTLKEEEEYYLVEDFSGEKLGDDLELFDKIAKCCKDGGYIEFLGEDGDRFRLVIKDGKCEETNPEIVW